MSPTMKSGPVQDRTQRFYGLVTGVVSNLKDPDGEGRVTVRFSWMGKTIESNWARVAAPMAGKDRGAFFLPIENDEVLVAFENGDFRSPYVIGALWNNTNTAPVPVGSDGVNQKRMIRSVSGHTVTFDDTPDKEKLTIVSKGGHTVSLDDTQDKSNVMVSSKAGHRITMSDKAGEESLAITSSSGHTITMSDSSGKETISIQDMGKKHKIVLESNGAITIISGQDLKIEASGSVTINNGTQGAARLDDLIKSDTQADSRFWQWVNEISLLMATHTHLDAMGSTQPSGLKPSLIPSDLTGKIVQASGKVKIG